MTDLEQLTEAIFETAMDSYDEMISDEADPGVRAVLAFHRDAAVAAARGHAAREAHRALCGGSAPSVVH